MNKSICILQFPVNNGSLTVVTWSIKCFLAYFDKTKMIKKGNNLRFKAHQLQTNYAF